MTDQAGEPSAVARVTVVVVKLLAGLATLVLWQLVGSVLYDFGAENLRPQYHFGTNQVLCLLGASALSVMTAGMPHREGRWLVPGAALAVVAVIAVGTAFVTSLIVESVVIQQAGTASQAESWAGQFLGVLFCLVPVSVYAAAAIVRHSRIRHLTGVLILSAVSLLVPSVAFVSLIFDV